MTLTLRGDQFGNASQLHNYLCNQLRFPAWYGRNLDALYDCLTPRGEDVTICLENWPESGFTAGFLRVFQDAAAENPHIQVVSLPLVGKVSAQPTDEGALDNSIQDTYSE
ncbi:MAG: barstar family protein [Oscillospiraceae bacterium]|nr:barstar family protein [Oscillospiraceae bacterium]